MSENAAQQSAATLQRDALAKSLTEANRACEAIAAQRDTLAQVMTETASELGCENDNEAILEAIAALRTERDTLGKSLRDEVTTRLGAEQECAAALARARQLEVALSLAARRLDAGVRQLAEHGDDWAKDARAVLADTAPAGGEGGA